MTRTSLRTTLTSQARALLAGWDGAEGEMASADAHSLAGGAFPRPVAVCLGLSTAAASHGSQTCTSVSVQGRVRSKPSLRVRRHPGVPATAPTSDVELQRECLLRALADRGQVTLGGTGSQRRGSLPRGGPICEYCGAARRTAGRSICGGRPCGLGPLALLVTRQR